MENQIIPFLPSYLICVDYYRPHIMKGRIVYGERASDCDKFTDVTQLLLRLEDIMNALKCPQSGNKVRHFDEKNKGGVLERTEVREALRAMRKLDLNSENGKKATFVLQVKFRQNATWQGTIKWVEKKKEISFRSALELIKIIDSACEEGYEAELLTEDGSVL